MTDAGIKVALVRHPMTSGDLESTRVQRFASLEDIDAAHPTIEEREELERPVELGMVMYAGVDYGEILDRAEQEADVIVWDGGKNDFPFFAPDLFVVVVDPLRPGHELRYHPGETNLRMADVVVVNKVDSATPEQVDRVIDAIREVNPPRASSRPRPRSRSVMARRCTASVSSSSTTDRRSRTARWSSAPARWLPARAAPAVIVDPRAYAVGSIAELYEQYPHIRSVLPAMGYSDEQLHELEETINATPCDVVVTGTPIDLARLIKSTHPIRHATYELRRSATRPWRTRSAGDRARSPGSSEPSTTRSFRRDGRGQALRAPRGHELGIR